MNREEIISMARKAGLPDPMVFALSYQRFAILVAAKEREECAKVCDKRMEAALGLQGGPAGGLANLVLRHHAMAQEECSKSTRARGEIKGGSE